MTLQESMGIIAGAIAMGIASYQAARGKATTERLKIGNDAFAELRAVDSATIERVTALETEMKQMRVMVMGVGASVVKP